MQELRLVAVSEDGSYAVMVAPGRSGRFALPIDERLRTIARGQFSRLAQYEIEVENPLRPKEIQERIRAGETAEEIADTAGLPIDKVRRFEGPVLAEREFRAQEAQRASVRGHNEPGPGPRLGEIVSARLTQLGAIAQDAEWDTRKRSDGNWQLQAGFTAGGRDYLAEWVYDARGKHVTPANDQAARLCLPEADWPAEVAGSAAGMAATVTPIGSRLAAAGQLEPDRLAGHGGAAPRPVRRPVQPAAGSAVPGAQPAVAGPLAARPEPAGLTADHGSARAGRAEPEWLPAEHAPPDVPVPAALPDPDAAAVGEPARRARRAVGGRRRSSVPTWDEIMFGNSRPAD